MNIHKQSIVCILIYLWKMRIYIHVPHRALYTQHVYDRTLYWHDIENSYIPVVYTHYLCIYTKHRLHAISDKQEKAPHKVRRTAIHQNVNTYNSSIMERSLHEEGKF